MAWRRRTFCERLPYVHAKQPDRRIEGTFVPHARAKRFRKQRMLAQDEGTFFVSVTKARTPIRWAVCCTPNPNLKSFLARANPLLVIV